MEQESHGGHVLLNFSFVFPGQGSQSLGMLKSVNDAYPIVKQAFDEASSILGFDAWALAQEGPEQALNQTENTQPLLLAADVALWRLYKSHSPSSQPNYLAGHSLGEYAALVAAGAMRFEDAVYLVRERGKLMQWAAPKGSDAGSMAAILSLENALIEAICTEVTQSSEDKNYLVSPANYNSIGQTVIAGHPDAVARAAELMKEKGAKRAIVLPVSVPSHCALMQPAADKFAELLEKIDIQSPNIPVLHNRDVQSHTQASEIRRILCEQLVYPVRWVETIQTLSEQGITEIVECGPGKVLAGLIKRIDSGLRVFNMDTPQGVSETLCLETTP